MRIELDLALSEQPDLDAASPQSSSTRSLVVVVLHLASRDFFVAMDHPVAGVFKYPGAAYRFSNAELPLGARAAPLLGQHNEMILGDLE